MEHKKVSSPNRAKKEQIVAKLSDKLAKSKGLVFANYQGLTHKQLEKLKKAIKALNAELVVTKNTLLKLALQKVENVEKVDSTSSTPSTSSTFNGPTATLFLYADPIEPLKQLAKTIKELNLRARNAFGEAVAGGGSIKFGIIDGQNLDSEQIIKLATLPSRETLIAQLIFEMKAPIYGLHRVIRWNLQRLVATLKEIESKKQAS